ncbi:MAG: rod shape-determining protein MreD [Alphaproteobacteria bacterium]
MIAAPVRRVRWYTQIAPVATVIAAVLLDLLWIPVPGFNAVAPAFAVMAVYCWAVWRPEYLPYTGVFAAGLLEDLVRGTPLGAGALALLAAQGFVWAQQRLLRSRSFEVMWFGFAVAALLAAAISWAAVAFSYRAVLSPWPGAMQYVLTVAAFPALALLLMRIERGMPRPA